MTADVDEQLEQELAEQWLTGVAPVLDALGGLRDAMQRNADERERLYVQRRAMFLQLRDAGVEHKVIAKAAGVTVPAVIQQTEKARDESAEAAVR